MFPLKSTDNIKNLHENLKLAGKPSNGLLSVRQDLLFYILALFREETPLLPKVPLSEWRELLSMLGCHGVIPLLYWKISQLPSNLQPPEEIVSKIRQNYLAARSFSFRIENQLKEIIEAFQREKIRALVIKGPALGRMVYPDPVLRPSGDIDILVHPESFIKARDMMEVLGYYCTGKRFETARDFYCEEIFFHQTDIKIKRQVDLHWQLDTFCGRGTNPNIDKLFDNSSKITAQNIYFDTCNPIDTLIYLSVHLIMKHCQEMRLIWIYDIALIAKEIKTPQAWKELQEKSFKNNTLLAVENSLKLAQEWCGLTLPFGLGDFAAWPVPNKEDEEAYSHALNKHHSFPSMIKLHWSASSSPWEKAKYFFNTVFPPPSHFDKSYYIPLGFLPFAYIHRLGRWGYSFLCGGKIRNVNNI